GSQRARRPRRPSGLQRREGCLGGEAARLDRVVDPLQRRHVDEAGGVARQKQAGCMELSRQRDETALGNRLRAPPDPLAAVEEPTDESVRLQLLEQVVNGDLDIPVVEPDDHSDSEHVVAHRVDERAAELAIPAAAPQRPPHGVDDPIERACDLPHLLHAQRPHLRVVAGEPEMVQRDAGQVSLGSLGEHGPLRGDVGAGLEVPERLAVLAKALVPGADADRPRARDEQLLGGGLGEDRRAAGLRRPREPARELRERRDEVPVVAHRRRRWDPQRGPVGQVVGALVVDRAVGGDVLDTQSAAAIETPKPPWVDDRARDEVRTDPLAFLENGYGHFAQALSHLGGLLDQLSQADRTGEPGWARSDDQHPDIDSLLGWIARRGDELSGVERWRKVSGSQDFLWRTSSVSLGTTSFRSPTTPRSQKSKIGALGSLLIATITPELCMPTLCWIAPEI